MKLLEHAGPDHGKAGRDLEDDAAARSLLTACASADGLFREASTSDIEEIFDEIFEEIAGSVWLSG